MNAFAEWQEIFYCQPSIVTNNRGLAMSADAAENDTIQRTVKSDPCRGRLHKSRKDNIKE